MYSNILVKRRNFVFRLFVIVQPFVCSISAQQNIYGIQMEDFNSKIILSNIIDSRTGHSLFQCSNLCLKSEYCMSFFYNINKEKCQTHSVVFQDVNAAKMENGTKYYRVYNEQCKSSDGYLHNRALNLCYKFTPEPERMDVDKYKLICKSEGGELLKITSEDIQNHIANYLEQFDTKTTSVQGSDDNPEFKWIFDDGTELKYTNWGKGEPLNGYGFDYLFLDQNANYTWFAGSKLMYRPGGFICNKELST